MSIRQSVLCALVVAAGFSFSTAHAQGFIKAVTEQGQISGNQAIVVTGGEEITGKISGASFSMGSLKGFSIKNESGTKTKYKSADVKTLRVKVDTMMKLEMFAEGDSIVDIASTDFDEIAERDYVIFEQALMPSKKTKPRLLQLVNPGFDGRIKVYYNPSPNAKESKGFMGITGGKPKSYLVVRDGDKSIKVKKDEFKKRFPELFTDCPEFTKTYSDKKSQKWEYFPEHVFVYNQQCTG